MAGKETSRFIVVPQRIREEAYHNIAQVEKEVGPLWKYMDSEMVLESDVTAEVQEVVRDPSEGLDVGPSLHKHEANQLFCLVGDVKVEVTLGADKHMVTGPAAILVPAGMDHTLRVLGGRGYMFEVLSSASYQIGQ